MGVTKRQGREKPAKIEQRKVTGRSKDRSEDLRQNKQHSWLAQFTQGRPRGRIKHIKRSQKALSLSLLHAGTLPNSFLFMSLGEHALKPRGWILLLFSKQNRAVTWSCNTDLSKSYNTICSRHESCDVPTALMSITPNLCCDETKLRRIHLPDKMMEEKNWHPSSRLWSLTL